MCQRHRASPYDTTPICIHTTLKQYINIYIYIYPHGRTLIYTHTTTIIYTHTPLVCMLFYVLPTYTKQHRLHNTTYPEFSVVTSGWVPTCDCAHSWRLYSAAPLKNQVVSTITLYATQAHTSTAPYCVNVLPLS